MNKQQAKRIAAGAAASLLHVNIEDADGDLYAGFSDLPERDYNKVVDALYALVGALSKKAASDQNRGE